VTPTPNTDLRQRAEALTRQWGGNWNEATHKGRDAVCQICGCYSVAITPKAGKGVLLICNEIECRAGKERGDDRLITAARMDGFDCGPGNGSKSHWRGIHPAPSEALVGMKPAERRVLKYCASQTSTGEPFEVTQREIAKNCGGSKRDAIPYLERLKARGLIRIRSNKYAAKRPTQIAFLFDPVDLSRRLVDPPENGVTPSENGVTMERPLVRIRESTC
jgi:hypothetical protein